MLIEKLEDLLELYSADDATRLNHEFYDATSCGGYICVKTPDGVWHNCGEDWSGITEIVAFKIGAIFEGSEAEFTSDEMTLPVDCDMLDDAVERLECMVDEAIVGEPEDEELDAEEEEQDASDECYYGDPDVCRGDTWECETCGETYCEAHNHSTDKGENVECVACEGERLREENEPGEEDITTTDGRTYWQSGKKWLVIHEDDIEDDARLILDKMEEDQFWPTVWSISDHGNADAKTDLDAEAAAQDASREDRRRQAADEHFAEFDFCPYSASEVDSWQAEEDMLHRTVLLHDEDDKTYRSIFTVRFYPNSTRIEDAEFTEPS